MTGLFSVRGYLQTTPEMTQEGLPFWLFWFLLFAIVLLLAFIFLRDKDLRRRLSAFLSGARRHMLRLRLQAKLKREKDKKVALWKELGKRAWSEDFRTACIEAECEKLATYEEDIGHHQKTWHDIYSRIEDLARQHEETLRRFRELTKAQEAVRRPREEEMAGLVTRRKEIEDALEGTRREIETAEAQIKAIDREVRAIEDNPKVSETDRAARLDKAREKAAALVSLIRALQEKVPLLQEERVRLDPKIQEAEAVIAEASRKIGEIEDEHTRILQRLEREIREWQKNKDRVQDKIVEINRLMDPLFESMGKALDESRPDVEDLAVVFFQIDGVNKLMADLQNRLEHLR